MAKALATAKRASARKKTKTASDDPLPAQGSASDDDKPKGGPVPGTPSPMRTRLSAALQAYARRKFETTEECASDIALDCGVDESVIRRMALREGWVRFVAPPRDLPAVATLLIEVEAFESEVKGDRHPEVRAEGEPRRMAETTGAVVLRGAQERAPQDDGEGAAQTPPTDSRCSASAIFSEGTAAEGCPSPPFEAQTGGGEKTEPLVSIQENIARFIRIVMAHLDEFEAIRRDGKLTAKNHLATARGISILTEAFNKLQRLRAAQPGQNHDDSNDRYADMPADLDAFREALAQRIEGFLASRTDAEAFADAAAERVAGAE